MPIHRYTACPLLRLFAADGDIYGICPQNEGAFFAYLTDLKHTESPVLKVFEYPVNIFRNRFIHCVSDGIEGFGRRL